MDYMKSEYKRIIDEHKSMATESGEPRDFISAYLRKIELVKDGKNSSFSGSCVKYHV